MVATRFEAGFLANTLFGSPEIQEGGSVRPCTLGTNRLELPSGETSATVLSVLAIPESIHPCAFKVGDSFYKAPFYRY